LRALRGLGGVNDADYNKKLDAIAGIKQHQSPVQEQKLRGSGEVVAAICDASAKANESKKSLGSNECLCLGNCVEMARSLLQRGKRTTTRSVQASSAAGVLGNHQHMSFSVADD